MLQKINDRNVLSIKKKIDRREKWESNVPTINAQLVGIVLEIDECIDEIVSAHIILLPVLYGVPGNVRYERGHVMIVQDISQMLVEPRYFSEYHFNHHLWCGAEDPAAYFLKLIVFLFQRVHFEAERARSDHVDREFGRQIPALDDIVFRCYLAQILFKVVGTVQQQVKHVFQLSGREDGREPRS